MRWLALNRWLPFRRFRYYFIPSAIGWFDSRTFKKYYVGPVALRFRCYECLKKTWAEEISNNFGCCEQCTNRIWDEYNASDHS